MEVYLIRHTTPLIEQGICYGQSDLDLANTFPDELEFLKRNLPAEFDAVYTSPLKRCITLAKKFKTPNLFTDARLMELNFGEWEMKKWNEIDQIPLNDWMIDFVNFKIPAGESFMELSYRVAEFMDELKETSSKNIAVVTHGGIIRAVIAGVFEIPLKNAFKISIDYSSITHIQYNKDTYPKVKKLNLSYYKL